MFKRNLQLPPSGTETFFLWGPRQTGKSTFLKATYPHAVWIDLLMADRYRLFMQRPETLRAELRAIDPVQFVVIDEVQKVPALLDEVHWLHENLGIHFALCGSSARKVRRGHANLMGGRAVRYLLHGLSAAEIGTDFDLTRMVNNGYLPRMYLAERPARLLEGYVADYLKEEVAAEGLARNLPAFSEFLNVAALSDTELVNCSTIARECGVSSPTIKGYFDILIDTLLAYWLPAYRKRPKRRVIRAPKFYFADVGVVNFLARRGRLTTGSELFGKAFENWCLHELRTYDACSLRGAQFAYWRLASGIEVDFVINDFELVIESKATAMPRADHLRNLRELAVDHPGAGRRMLVCLTERLQKTADGIEIVPYQVFVERLWSGKLF
jgi:uncharacterized protein